MAKSDLIYSLSLLSRKIDALLEQQNQFRKRIDELEKDNNALRAQLAKKEMMLSNTEKDVEFLSLSYRLADSPEALVKARKEISSLLRTIDSCIRLLKED